MKLRGCFFGWLSGVSFLVAVSSATNSVQAQCVQADVGIQYSISGSRQPTERSNEVEMESKGSCRGNASVTVGVQGHEGGTGSVRQQRRVRHRFEGQERERGVGGSTVQIKVNPQIDVYNSAEQLNY